MTPLGCITCAGGDYSEWFKQMIKDDELAQYTQGIENDGSASPHESRAKIKDAITNRYTSPA